MNTGPVLSFLPSADSPVERPQVRAQVPSLPGSKGDSIREIGSAQNSAAVASGPQDVVKVQMEPPGEIVVYQFVDQEGSLILQVPPQTLINLARQISQELAQEAAPTPAPIAKGENNGH